MKIWLDTIDLTAIQDAARTGILYGVTTNPSILSKAKHVPETLAQILEIQPGPLAVQVTSFDAESMIEEGRALFAYSKRIVVKIPVNQDGLIAIRTLSSENIPTLGTAVFHPLQALLAANNGAAYIAPYFSHIGENAYETLKTMHEILQTKPTQILAASIKHLDTLVDCARLGIDSVTIKEDLYYQLVATHPLTDKFTRKFHAEWSQAHGELFQWV